MNQQKIKEEILENKLLEIFEKNKIYSDTTISKENIEFDFEDESGNSFLGDIKFINENSESPHSDYIQSVKLDLLKSIWKEAQRELLTELWYTTSNYGQLKRYELIYDKIVKKLNEN